ncbi:MAG: condensation domain-containing protein, partial [Oscillospiraceae bacterium]|nr:condensation domain-containing protein [Oscillospiraceae bacterium]
MDDKLSRLSPEKKAMLEKLLREKRLQQTPNSLNIKPVKQEDNRYPLTFAQEKIWIANNISPDATIYNMIGIARMQGNANLEGNAHIHWFVEALKETFERHEILKMHFKQDNGELYSEIDDEMVFEPEIHDFSNEFRDRDFIVYEMVNQLAGKPFNLEKDTLIRAALVCTAPDDWTVILVMHHLIGDGMSINIVLGETLEYCYNKYNNIRNIKPPLPIQFKDFAWWERNKDIESIGAELAKKYWNDQLNGADFSLDILKQEQGLTHFDEIAVRKDMHINTDVVKKIQQIAQNEKITVFSLYFAVLKLLIFKYSMQKDIMTGVITAGRDLLEVQPMVGCFVDILPVRTIIDDNLTFAEFMRNSYKSFLENYEKKDAFLNLGESPIYQLLFNYKEIPDSNIEVENLEIQSYEIDNGFSRASVDFELIKSGEEIIGGINYRKGALDDEFVDELISRYYLILDKLADGTSGFLNKEISKIEIIDESERHQLVEEFNETAMEYPKEQTVVDLFEEQVAKAPDSIAMTFEGHSLSYGELNAKSNVLARQLRELGVKPGDYVALQAERSFEQVIGIYGIIKSGGAYVPIDTDSPPERLKYMLNDCDAKAILTYNNRVLSSESRVKPGMTGMMDDAGDGDVEEIRSENVETDEKIHALKDRHCDPRAAIPHSHENLSIPVIDLSDSSVYIGDESNLPHVNTPGDDFYLIYTSGTTGEPKGVMCQHKGTVNLISYLQENYPIDENSTVLQKTSYTFDASIVEIFRWSLTGAKGHLLSPGDEMDPYRTCEEIHVGAVTEMQIVPSMLKTMLLAVKSDKEKY